MNKHLKSIFKVCGITGLICVLCVLCCLPFVNFTDSKVEVHADSVNEYIDFTSQNFFITASLYSSSIISPQTTGYTLYNGSVNFFFANGHGTAIGIEFYPLSNNFGSNYFSCVINDPQYNDYYMGYLTGVSGYHFMFHYYIDTDFNNNVVSYRIRSVRWGGTNTSIAETVFDFYDTNGNRLAICFFGNFDAGISNFDNLRRNNIIWYGDRTYYTNVSLTNNEYFLQGQQYGEQIGEERGFRDGRAKGYEEGKKDGIDIGIEQGTDYSFVSFFTGLFDAPVAMVYNALDFELLGVNLYDFFCGLITVFLCLALIRFIRGK